MATKIIGSTDRCSQLSCGFDSVCNSGKCFNATCLATDQPKPTCNATVSYLSYSEVDGGITSIPSLNRCEQSPCSEDTQCQTGYCCKECNAEAPVCTVRPPNDDDSSKAVTISIIVSVVILLLVAAVGGYFYYVHKKRQGARGTDDDDPFGENANESQGLIRNAGGQVNQSVTNSVITRD